MLIAGCATQQKPAENATPSENTAATTEAKADTSNVYTRPEVKTAEEAKKLLMDGNARFVSAKVLGEDLSQTTREKLAKGQAPFAVVVTCSDSRVPPELIFDQGLGDIFIIRTAGNVVDPVTIGSVEYGAAHCKAPLLVVMGHESCGAVKATVEGGKPEGSIGSIVAKIQPSLAKVKAGGAKEDELVEKTVDENIKAVIAELEKSPVIEELVKGGKLTIVGAKYHLETGEVEWLAE